MTTAVAHDVQGVIDYSPDPLITSMLMHLLSQPHWRANELQYGHAANFLQTDPQYFHEAAEYLHAAGLVSPGEDEKRLWIPSSELVDCVERGEVFGRTTRYEDVPYKLATEVFDALPGVRRAAWNAGCDILRTAIASAEVNPAYWHVSLLKAYPLSAAATDEDIHHEFPEYMAIFRHDRDWRSTAVVETQSLFQLHRDKRERPFSLAQYREMLNVQRLLDGIVQEMLA